MVEALLHASLDDVCESNRAQYAAVIRNQQRGSARIRNFSHTDLQLGRNPIPVIARQPADRLQGAFADLATVEVYAGHSRLCGERDEIGRMGRKIAAA